MKTLVEQSRGLVVLLEVNVDRFIAPTLIAVALAAASWALSYSAVF